jgi:type VI secretion system protein ImpJ
MHLAQHHFQAQSRYFENLTGFALSNLFFRSYGLVACEMDAEALLNGTVAVTSARGIMPDGLAFLFPEDPAPAALEIRELFSPTHDSEVVYLTIPAYRENAANASLEPGDNGRDARWVLRTERLSDETTGADEKPVGVARKNFTLRLGEDDSDDRVALPLARVRRGGSGHFVYDAEYIPPCLRIGASQRILGLLGRLIDMLDAKADSLMAERQPGAGAMSEYGGREVANFWLSHAVHSALGPLRYHLRNRSAHPEELFSELSRLGGALCTFSLDAHPRTLPLYDHDHLDRCFTALDAHIRAHLDVIMPTNAVRVPLARTADYLHTGTVRDTRCFGPSHWFLGVRSNLGQADVIGRTPRLAKVCSANFILRLVKEGLPGLHLEHVPTPPSAISPRIGTQYFSIQRAGPCWEAIVKTGEVGVYAPAALADAELEIAIVLEV